MTGFARRWGEGDPALLLHCALAHSGAWDGVARRLSDRVSMVAPDLIGHGRAGDGTPGAHYHDQLTAQGEAVLNEAGRPAHVIGHSYGATVALRLAIEQPDRVRSLTLIEPVLFAAAEGRESHAAQKRDFEPFGEAWAAGDRERATQIFIGMWGDTTPLADLPAKQRDYLVKTIWVIPAGRRALWEDSARLLPRLGQVGCPVLLMQGGASPEVIGDILSALARGLPQARRVRIPGAQHMGPITHADDFAAAIGDFLDTLP